MSQVIPDSVKRTLANVGLSCIIPYLENGGGSSAGSIVVVTGSRNFADSDNDATLVYDGTDDIELNLVSGLMTAWRCAIEQKNTGVITFTADAPADYGNVDDDTKTGGPRSMVAMIQDGVDNYCLSGATAP